MTTAEVTLQKMLVGGDWVEATGGATHEKTDPFTGAPASAAAAATREDASRAADAAADAFPAWAATSPGERRQLLNRAADLMLDRVEDFAAAMTAETGATAAWAGFNAKLASDMLRDAAAHTYAAVGDVIPSDVPGKLAMAMRAPAGVVVGIAPWNGPVILGTRAVATPLAFGNTVVLKASEECPRTHGLIADVLVSAGLPAGVINLVTNAPADAADVVDELIAHPAVRRINFTGSSRVGAIIAENAGRHLKRVLLELGGKSPLVVLADADLDRAVAAANFGAFMHQGQICMSTERIVVDRRISDEFAAQLAERAGALRVGDPREPETQIGPLINAAALERVDGMVRDAEAKGARVLAGGAAQGPCFEPTVLLGVSPEMRVYGEESFGPLASIVTVDGPDEAIAVANDTRYGLAAAIFSADVPTALELAQRIESGICHINDATIHDEPQMPFGGVKDSGWGRFGGKAAIEEFTELRWVTIQETARHYPI
jgi:benzaldehyde dehydrogenase (NAD)